MQIVKLAQEIGNGSHVYLPKEMAGHKVVITLKEKSVEEAEEEVLQILRPYLEHIMGIYLYGSYARGEQTYESDIDVLVITSGEIKLKKEGYDIVSGSLEQIEKTIKNNAVLILPILKEARSILNQQLIEKYKKEKLTKNNTKWYIETTESSLKLAKDWIEDKDVESISNIVYPLIMRLRGLYLIESLILNKPYSNRRLDSYLLKKGTAKIKQLNRMYREQRDNKDISSNSLDYDDITQLYDIVHKYFLRVRSLWERLK